MAVLEDYEVQSFNIDLVTCTNSAAKIFSKFKNIVQVERERRIALPWKISLHWVEKKFHTNDDDEDDEIFVKKEQREK